MKTKRIRSSTMNEPDLFGENDYDVFPDLFDGIVDFLNAPMEDFEVDIAEGDLVAELASPLDDLASLSCIFSTDVSKREERQNLPPFRKMESKDGQVAAAASSTSVPPDAQRKCMHCKVTTTPQWRGGPPGQHTLCNACGLCYKSGRLYPEYRPLASPTLVASSHSKFERNVIELANIVKNTSSRSVALLNDFPRNKRSSPVYESSEYPKTHYPKNINKKQERKKRGKLSVSSVKSSLVDVKIKAVHEDAIATSSILLAALHSNSHEKDVETVNKTGQEVAMAAIPTSVACANSPKKNPLQGKINQEVAITASSTIVAPLHSISCKNVVETANETERKVALAASPTSIASLGANSTKKNSLQEKVKGRKCMHCKVKSTPLWREGPMGLNTLCNACGVRYRSGRLLPEYRPLASPTFVASLHSNFHRKVLEMRKKVCKQAAVTTTNSNKCPARFDLNELPDLDELPDLNELPYLVD